MQTKNTKVLVLLSGGQDSTTCLMWAVKHHGSSNVRAIGFNYGQKHKKELELAARVAIMFHVPYELVDIRGILGESSLTNHQLDHNKPSELNKDLPASFTAGRNALFLTIAGAKAYGYGISTIITGVCQTDYSGYPDCRQEFINAQKIALSKAMDTEFEILTPLMNLTKAETWKLAKDLEIVNNINPLIVLRDMTMTDYNGDETPNEWGMGKLDNPASVIRAKGYFEAKEKGWV